MLDHLLRTELNPYSQNGLVVAGVIGQIDVKDESVLVAEAY